MTDLPIATVFLKPRRAKPFFCRHPWVFSGAVARVEGEFDPGDMVRVCDARGKFIARGYANPSSQIFVRLLVWEDAPVDEAFWRRRLAAAVRLRREVLALPERTNAFRLVNSEGDGLPGLIVDQYGDCLAVQLQTLGIARRRELLLDLLEEIVKPAAVFDRTDPAAARKEGTTARSGLLRGEEPCGPIEIQERGIRFLVDLHLGQKTGFFLDQRDNRRAFGEALARRGRGARVLDAFCYTGAFALSAGILGGAANVVGVDSSRRAIEAARANVGLNSGHAGPGALPDGCAVEFRVGKLPQVLREMRDEGGRFDAIVLDPPKLARSRPGLAKALARYREINAAAIRLLRPQGLLISCSCSQHVSEHDLTQVLNDAAADSGRALQVLERRGQAPDHPVSAACPESAYLKCLFCCV